MKPLLITNIVYGPEYAKVFLNHHLNGLLDETNIPSHAERIEYLIFTDSDTEPLLRAHPNFIMLSRYVKVHLYMFTWPENADKFRERYSVLVSTFRMSVKAALDRDAYLSALVADLVPAREFIPRILKRMDEGYDSVFMLPPRGAYEAMEERMDHVTGALSDLDLFDQVYTNCHPLWQACHFDSPQFTKLPFTLIWNTTRGYLVRSFSLTPIIFVPTHEMLSCNQVIDIEVPSKCKNPYWAIDWTDAPIAGMEFLHCYFPPFTNEPASIDRIVEFGKRHLHECQWPFIEKVLYYPKRNGDVSEVGKDVTDSIRTKAGR